MSISLAGIERIVFILKYIIVDIVVGMKSGMFIDTRLIDAK